MLSDWAIMNDCAEAYQLGAPAGEKPNPRSIGMPWGVLNISKEDRFAKAINAGIDQIGGTEDSQYIVEAVQHGKISEARVREAAGRTLLQKFQLGLFEQAYVDADAAGTIAARPEFVRDGDAAQAKAVVLLENKSLSSTGKPILPI